MKVNSYIKLRQVKAKNCKGKASAADVKKAAAAYIADTVKKGNKTKAEAIKSANAVTKGACAAIGAPKKKKAAKKATKAKTAKSAAKPRAARKK